MDFKVAGTKDGITAIQMDIKIKGINKEILERALEQARQGRLFILDRMLETIPAPREELSKWAPKIISFNIDPEKIGEVIGKNGKVINKIIQDTGVKMDIEDDGRVSIASYDVDMADKARAIVMSIVEDVEVGKLYEGEVVRILDFGAFVELAPNKDGMIHISKLAKERVEKVTDVVNIGDRVLVEVIKINMGKIDLRLRKKF